MTSNLFRHQLQVLVLILIVVIGGFFLYLDRTGQTLDTFSFTRLFTADYNIIRVGEISIEVEVVNTPEMRRRGLSGRSELGSAGGMLFVFPEAGHHGVWMKDMQFAIDIIWIDEHFKVVDLMRNVTPDTYPKVFEPDKPAKYVLETNILFIETFGVAEGRTVHIPKALRESR